MTVGDSLDPVRIHPDSVFRNDVTNELHSVFPYVILISAELEIILLASLHHHMKLVIVNLLEVLRL